MDQAGRARSSAKRGTPARRRTAGRQALRRQRGVAPAESALVVAGDARHREIVASSLTSLRIRIECADSVDDAIATPELEVVGVVLVPPLPEASCETTLAALRADSRTRRTPVFAVLPEDAPTRAVRSLYAAGATAVLEWPREALLLPRVVLELLSVAPQPRPVRPGDRSLARAASARLRLVQGVGEELRVAASDGVLHLRGSVSSLRLKETLLEFASRIPGVRGISASTLRVGPTGVSDRTVGRRVRGLLSGIVEGDTLSVSVNDGHVVLMGCVGDREAFLQVVGLLSSVSGVRALTNLTAESEARRRHDHRVASSLQRAVEQSHPNVQVRVAVLGDVAVLTGRVDLVATRSAIARRVRCEDEVSRVVDKIEVTGS